MSQRVRKFFFIFLSLSCALLVACGGSQKRSSAAQDVKQTFKSAGKAVGSTAGDAGKAVGKTASEAGKAVGETASELVQDTE